MDMIVMMIINVSQNQNRSALGSVVEKPPKSHFQNKLIALVVQLCLGAFAVSKQA